MKRTFEAAAALCAAAALAGCPLPQALPEYPKNKVTPPLVVTSAVTVNGDPIGPATIFVPAGCPSPPQYELAATVHDTDVTETVTARWFVDYMPDVAYQAARAHWVDEKPVDPVDQPDPTSPILTRAVTPYAFKPYAYESLTGLARDQAGNVHVVELVVSNDIAWPGETATPLPYRSTSSDVYETQVFRWVFLLVDPATNPAVTCPAP